MYKQDRLLPSREGAEVDSSETAYGHGANAVEKRVYVGYMILAIARVEYTGEYERRERAAR